MSFDECTDSILRESSFAQESIHSASTDSISTEALLNENYIGTSTESLINKDVRELLDEVFLQKSEGPAENNVVHNPDGDTNRENEEGAAGNRSLMTIWGPNSNISQDFETGDEESLRTLRGGAKDNHAQIRDMTKGIEKVQKDPIPLILFNKIQVFLLRNGMSLEFLKIFKRYVKHLIEDGMDPLEDQYLLALQNELSESFRFTTVMEDILNKFLLRPENLIMKLSLFEHSSAHNLLERYMRAWKLHGELRRSLTKLAGLWYDYLRRKFFIKWNQKYEEFAFHWDQQAQEFNKFTLASFGFDRWLDKMDSSDARKGLADHYFLNNIFQKIKRKRNVFNLRKSRSRELYDANVARWALFTWRLRYCETQFELTKLNLQRKMLGRLRRKLCICRAFTERADMFKYTWSISAFFKRWNESYRSTSSRTAHLSKLEHRFIKEKTMIILKDQLQRKQQEYVVSARLSVLLMKFFLQDLWFKRFKERLHVYSVWSIQNERIVGKFFAHWKKRLYTNLKAVEVARANALRWHLKKWKLELNDKLLLRKTLKIREEAFFTTWSQMTILEKRARKFGIIVLLKPIFSQWASRVNENKRLERIADINHDEILKIQFMICWHHKSLFLQALNQRAEILQKLRAMSMIKKSITHVQEVNKLAESFARLLLSKIYLSKHFNIWRQKFTLKSELKLRNLLESWKLEKQFFMKSKCFYLWKKRRRFYYEICLSKASDIYRRSLQIATLKILKQKLDECVAFIEVSNDFRNDSILSSTFYAWISHFKRLEEMDARVEVERNKKNLALLLNYLNIWGMGILKSRRNYEAVQVFRNRWDRATVRGLLLVWRTRMEKSLGENQGTVLRQDFELKTPIKRISPKNSNTIPGSERVKMHRIEAMKSHYSRVRRVIPSPLKSSLILNSSAKKKIRNEENNILFRSAQEFPKLRQQRTSQRLPPPPRMSLEKINKNLASKIDRINFERIPEVRLEPFINSDSQFSPIDRSLLGVEDDEAPFDESPTRRS